MACGDTHTLVATTAGEVFAFGRNTAGQLGSGGGADSLVPLRVEALRGKKVCTGEGEGGGCRGSACVGVAVGADWPTLRGCGAVIC